MDIEIIEVAYGRTINTGNYENVRIDFKAKVKAGQKYEDVLKALKRITDQEEARIRREHSREA